MDWIIYEYLRNNEKQINLVNDNHFDNDIQIFLDCLLILSINKIIINYNNLLDYCINIIKFNSKKRNHKDDDDNNSNGDIYYGLNSLQFKIFYKIIKSLESKLTDDCYNKMNSQVVFDQHLNNFNDNCNDKLSFSILLIIKNNFKFIEFEKNNKKNQSKRIKLNNNNSNASTKRNEIIFKRKNNIQFLEIDYNYLLFKKVWGNLTIRNQILFHLKLFNFHKSKVEFRYKDLKEYKYKYYLNSLILNENKKENVDEEEDDDDDYDDDDDDGYEDIGHLYYDDEDDGSDDDDESYDENESEDDEDESEDDEQEGESEEEEVDNDGVELDEEDDDYKFTPEHSKYISAYVNELCINYHTIVANSIPSTINYLVLGPRINQKLTKNMFIDSLVGSDNITHLEFGKDFNQSLSDSGNMNEQLLSWLPCNLKSLKFGSSFQQSISIGQLPTSLVSLKFHYTYNGTIVPNSIPKSVTTLNYKFKSNFNNKKINKNLIPSSITNLEFDKHFDQVIEKDFVPHNVTSLTFGSEFNSIIKPGSLPHSIQTIVFGNIFNKPIRKDTLPPNLTSLTFGDDFSQPLTINNQSLLPRSITQLDLGLYFNQVITKNTFKSLGSLTALRIGGINDDALIVDALPNSITTLDLGIYGHAIHPSLLPKSLKSLSYSLIDNETPIKINSLPKSITSLKWYNCFNQTNIPKQLPKNLKSVSFSMPGESIDDLSLIDWQESLETINITDFGLSNAFPLLNNVSTDFLFKYIKIKN